MGEKNLASPRCGKVESASLRQGELGYRRVGEWFSRKTFARAAGDSV